MHHESTVQSEAGNPPVRDTQRTKDTHPGGTEPSGPTAGKYEPRQTICLFCLPQQPAYRNPHIVMKSTLNLLWIVYNKSSYYSR